MNTDSHHPRPSRMVTVLKVLLPVLALGAGGWWAKSLIDSAPKAPMRSGNARVARLVEVAEVDRGLQWVQVEAMGTVKPAREVDIHPRVTGMVKALAPDLRPGGAFRTGDPLLWLEEDDLSLEVKQREAAVAVARGDYDLERGQQAIAREELALIREPLGDEDKRWVLREPQLQSAAAKLQSAEAALQQAQLDLSRAVLTAPFNAVVLDRSAEAGSQISPSSVVATMAGTDTFWIELAVPSDDLKWVSLPGPDGMGGSDVRLTDESAWPVGTHRDGKVIGLAANLDTASRMARVLVAVDDPLSMKPESAGKPRLLLNAFVHAEIQGDQVPDAVLLTRSLLRQGDTVWLMDAKDNLEIRPVKVLYRGEHEVVVSEGLSGGERVVSSNLRTPVPGMALRTEKADPSGDKKPGPKVAGPAAP